MSSILKIDLIKIDYRNLHRTFTGPVAEKKERMVFADYITHVVKNFGPRTLIAKLGYMTGRSPFAFGSIQPYLPVAA